MKPINISFRSYDERIGVYVFRSYDFYCMCDKNNDSDGSVESDGGWVRIPVDLTPRKPLQNRYKTVTKEPLQKP